MGDIWLSLVRCAPSNRRTHAAFQAFLWRFSEIEDAVADDAVWERTLSKANFPAIREKYRTLDRLKAR
jgi:hypothetical protein